MMGQQCKGLLASLCSRPHDLNAGAPFAHRHADYTLEKGDVYWVTMAQLLAWMKNPVPASQLRKSKAMCAPPQAAQPTPQLPLNGANVTLTFKGEPAKEGFTRCCGCNMLEHGSCARCMTAVLAAT
jgi:hypothetical protein